MRGLSRALALVAACAAVASSPGARAADVAPEQLQFAEQEHDRGYRAYVAHSFDDAAAHFENAFFAAPNPDELHSAIRARREGGRLARAATLAAIAERMYPADAGLGKFAEETIALARPKTAEVHVVSALECNVAVDDKLVVTERLRDYRFFVEPGKHELLVGWPEGRTKQVSFEAKAATSQTLTLTPPPVPAKPSPVIVASPAPPAPVPASSRPLPPVVFFIGAGLTAVGVGVTAWSGLDTEKNPGTAAVRADCVGQGTSCPTYQQGLDAQRRTNILLGVTGGMAAVTAVVGIFFTRWGGGDTRRGGLTVEPAIGIGQAALKGTF